MRRGLRWSLAGAVALLAMVSLLVIPAFGDTPVMGQVGVLRLHLNTDGDRLVYDPSTGADLTQTLSQSSCKLASSGDSLATLVGTSSNSSKKPFAGLKDHRIGVGQSHEDDKECARINKDLGQKLTLSLTGAIGDKSISYAEIDLGFTHDGSAEIELRNDGTLVSKVTVSCAGKFACGPDSKKGTSERVILWVDAADNPGAGKWQAFKVAGVFDTVIVKPVSSSHKGKDASVSLQGGFKGAASGPLGTGLGTGDTLFKLVAPFDGELDCLESTTLGGGNAVLDVTRANDTDGGCKGPVNGLLFNFDSGVEGSRLFVDLATEPVDGTAVAQFLEVLTWTFGGPPTTPDQFRTLSYDDHVGQGERVMPWCLVDPRVDGSLPAGLDPATVLPAGHTSCRIESSSHMSPSGFVTVDVVYNIGDGKRWT